MTRARRSFVAHIVALLGVAAVVPAAAQNASVAVQGEAIAAPVQVTAAFDASQPLSADGSFTLRLDRPLAPEEGRLAVIVAGVDVSALLQRTANGVTYVPRAGMRMAAGAQEIRVYRVSGGRWEELTRIAVRILTPRGFTHASAAPTLGIGNKGQLAERHSPLDTRPERPTYQDATLNGGLQTAHGRAGWELRTQSSYIGVTNRMERLRFAQRGDRAPRLDLADYRVELQRGVATLSAGNVSVGVNPYLVSAFPSRGVTVGLARGPASLTLGAVNGTNIVGWDNLVGLSTPEHRIGTATLGLELVPSRPGAAKLDLTLLDASILPLTSYEQGAIVDAERSRGGGLQVGASSPSQRLRFSGGWARSRFDNPDDSLLSGGATLVPVRATTRDARFAEVGIGLLQNLRPKPLPALALALVARHERVDPTFRSPAASVQADLQRSALDLTGSIGALSLQGGFTRANDNLANVASILRTHTRTGRGAASLPIGSLLGRRGASAWWPTLALTHDATHQWGAGTPAVGGFSDTHVPDQASRATVASAQWTGARWRAAAKLDRSAQDNRQVGREHADFDAATLGLNAGLTLRQGLDVALDLSEERQTSHETSQRARVRRVGGTADWRPFVATTLSTAISVNRSDDDPRTNEATTTDARVELTQGVPFRAPSRGVRGQLFLRWARQAARTLRIGDPALLDPTLDPRTVRDLWTLTSGATLTVF